MTVIGLLVGAILVSCARPWTWPVFRPALSALGREVLRIVRDPKPRADLALIARLERELLNPPTRIVHDRVTVHGPSGETVEIMRAREAAAYEGPARVVGWQNGGAVVVPAGMSTRDAIRAMQAMNRRNTE